MLNDLIQTRRFDTPVDLQAYAADATLPPSYSSTETVGYLSGYSAWLEKDPEFEYHCECELPPPDIEGPLNRMAASQNRKDTKKSRKIKI